ncbi:shikimate dehydrogenase [Candidatus Sumerlaeota bacterium]
MPELAITGKTNIVGVLGWPVEHSLSPPMHNAAYAQMGLDYAYVPFPVAPEQLERALAGLAVAGVRGLNLTIPHKRQVIELLDEISDEARQIEAVNTLKLEDGRLLGFNTDRYGFTEAVTETGFSFDGCAVVMLGAGGVACAMGFGAADAGASSLTILNRTVEKARDLAGRIAVYFPDLALSVHGPDAPQARQAVTEADIVLNATSIGMRAGDDAPVPVDWLAPRTYVYDTVYNRPTRLLAAARERGCRALDGATMLVHQGAKAIEIWTGTRPDTQVMLDVLRQHLRP